MKSASPIIRLFKTCLVKLQTEFFKFHGILAIKPERFKYSKKNLRSLRTYFEVDDQSLRNLKISRYVHVHIVQIRYLLICVLKYFFQSLLTLPDLHT